MLTINNKLGDTISYKVTLSGTSTVIGEGKLQPAESRSVENHHRYCLVRIASLTETVLVEPAPGHSNITVQKPVGDES